MKKTREKSGKKLEKLIGMIQETLKDSPFTKIHTNYKIPNASGRKREIDVLIESKINDITIKIAIECKEYKKPVSVDKMEAFITKCNRIPDINKKIFVSQNGYQADAINAAKEFGIELYEIQNESLSVIEKKFPKINQLGIRLNIRTIALIPDKDNKSNGIVVKDNSFHFYDGKPTVSIEKYLQTHIFENRNFLQNYTMLAFFNRGCKEPEKKIDIPFEINFNDIFVLNENDNKIPVRGISVALDMWLEEENVVIEEANSFINLNGEAKAENIAIPIGGKEKTNLIMTKDKFSIFHTDENGFTQQLKILATLNPKKNEKGDTKMT